MLRAAPGRVGQKPGLPHLADEVYPPGVFPTYRRDTGSEVGHRASVYRDFLQVFQQRDCLCIALGLFGFDEAIYVFP